MTLLAVQDVEVRVGIRHGAPALLRGDQVYRALGVNPPSEVHLYGAIELSAAARQWFLRQGIDILFFSRAGTFRGRLTSAESHQAERRRSQYRWLDPPGQVLVLAKCFVAAKLANQRVVLRRARHHAQAGDALADALAALRALERRVDSAPTLDSLRGLEGQAAALYFRGWAQALKHPVFTFEARKRRPPPDPVNAALSFCYTLLVTRVESALYKAGLDPHLGALHDPGRGKPALALDLAEEWRPVIDRLVFRLLNQRRLAPSDFEDPRAHGLDISSAPGESGQPENQGPVVYLGPTGRAVVLKELSAMWQSRHRYGVLGHQHTFDDILGQQAYRLVALFEGREPRYEGFALDQ